MMSPVVYVLRTVHVLIALFLAACLIYLYYVILTRAGLTAYVWIALAAILVEGIVFVGLGQDCPFSIWQRRYGDPKGFFELFLPRQAALVMFPILLGITAPAVLMILLRAFHGLRTRPL